MPSPEFWTAVATAGTNQIGNIISTAMANDANERMQHEQNKWNLEQWNRNNAYNSPAAQMQRFKAAGLNPDLMYQQGTPGISSAPAQGSNPIPKQPFQMQLDPLMLAQLKNIEADTNLKKSDAKQKDALTIGINFDNFTKEQAAEWSKEWLKSWNSYSEQDKREMFDNIISTLQLEKRNALKAAKNGEYQNEEDYWNHMMQLYTIYGSLYGFDGLSITDGGIDATEDWITRKQEGQMKSYIKDSILGALKEGNIDFVEKQFEILDATLLGQKRENAKKLLENDLLKIEKRIKELERDYQEWYNDDSITLEFFGIKFSPREWQVVGPMAKEFVSLLGELDNNGDPTIIGDPQGETKKGKKKTKGKKGTKTTPHGTKGFKMPKIPRVGSPVTLW